MKLLLSAPPQVGKSTVMASVVESYRRPSCGIIAREMLDATGRRIGFTAINSALESRQFMFHTEQPHESSVGEFDVDVTVLDDFVVPELSRALADSSLLVYVDEIGRAQAKSSAFLNILRELFKSCCNMLASIVYDDEPWSLEFKRNTDVCLLEVTLENRNILPEILALALSESASFASLSKIQQELTYTLLRRFIASGQYNSAKKLFKNALPYVLNERLQLQHSQGDLCQYVLSGLTKEHHITWNRQDYSFDCDCDLANGRGAFADQPETCSHQMCVLLTYASCQAN